MQADKIQKEPFIALTSRDHCISPGHHFSRIQSQHLKYGLHSCLYNARLEIVFWFQTSVTVYLFHKVYFSESTHQLVLNTSFLVSLLTKSCISFSVFRSHMMLGLSTSKPSCVHFLNAGTTLALLQSSKILLNVNISKPSN